MVPMSYFKILEDNVDRHLHIVNTLYKALSSNVCGIPVCTNEKFYPMPICDFWIILGPRGMK